MLSLRGVLGVADAELRVHLAIGPGILVNAVDRRGLIYDSRLVARDQPLVGPGWLIYLVLESQVHWHATNETASGPTGFVLPVDELESSSNPRRRTVRMDGARFRAVELWVAGAPRIEGMFALTPGVVAATEHYFATCHQEAQFVDGAGRRAEVDRLLDALAAAGVVEERPPEAPELPASLKELWAAVEQIFARLDLGTTQAVLSDLAGRSQRQTNRDFAKLLEMVDAPGDGFRDALQRFRLRVAVMLLSAEGASIADVATAVGYARPEAMSNAFQRAGLAPPGQIRRALLG